MKKHKIMILGWLLSVCLMLLIPQVVQSETKPKGNPPVITHSYAVEKGHYGYIWKIFIGAHDPDGDMSRIAVVVNQTGAGHYPTDWIVLKSPYQKQFKGYIQWNTFSSRTSALREWTNITLTVSIFDRAGNESNEVVFPFEFVSGGHQTPQPIAPFNEGGLPRLGYIHIDLIEPTLMGGLRRED